MEKNREQKCVVNGTEIRFKRKTRKYDTKHLLVVLSGFGAVSEFTYDFEHVLQEFPAHVLWIKDDFGSHCSYYMCQRMSFGIEAAILAFISAELVTLGLSKNECTLAGFSKGGSAVLYYGLKFGFPNLVATVPQFHVGTYVAADWPKVAAHMMGDVTPENIRLLDAVLPDMLDSDALLEKNIYLLTSPADTQYAEHIVPHLGGFVKYSNFNLIISRSRLVREHNHVTTHNVPIILSILYALSMGAPPRFGYTELTSDDTGPPEYPTQEPIAVLRQAGIDNGKLFPEGVAVLRGLSCGEYKDISATMILESADACMEFPLAKIHRPALTRELYRDGFVNYDKGWFCTYQHKGVDVQHVPEGHYRLTLRITCQGNSRSSQLASARGVDVQSHAGDHNLRLFAENGYAYFSKLPLAAS